MSSPPRIFKDSDELAAHAADQIVQITQEAIRVRGRAMVALAGGSTPKKSYRLLAQPDRLGRIDWAHTYLFFGDERFVRLEYPSSNFAMVQRTLLEPASVPAGLVFPVPTQLGTAAAAGEYAATLTKAFGIDGSGHPPRFDLILFQVLEGRPSREERPAAGVCPVAGTLTWLVDEAATSRLTRSG